MKQQFKLTQLYKSPSEFIMGTCQVHGNNDDYRFEVKIQGDKSFKIQLWQWVKGNWNRNKGIPCEVEFTDVNSEGLPTDGVIIEVHGFSPIPV